jgi:UDP-glucuronate 4-epimerase
MNIKQPFSTDDRVDYPISLYAATKKSNELMAHTYSHLYGIPTTGLRFFTVYGPYGRPDMAYFKFTKAILNGESIDVYNNGDMSRDFTYIDDIIDGVLKVIVSAPLPKINLESAATPPYKVFNIGNNNPVNLNDFINTIEKSCQKKAKKNFLPMQPGDVSITYANIDEFIKEFGFKPSTSISLGINKFVNWYLKYQNGEIL